MTRYKYQLKKVASTHTTNHRLFATLECGHTVRTTLSQITFPQDRGQDPRLICLRCSTKEVADAS